MRVLWALEMCLFLETQSAENLRRILRDFPHQRVPASAVGILSSLLGARLRFESSTERALGP